MNTSQPLVVLAFDADILQPHSVKPICQFTQEYGTPIRLAYRAGKFPALMSLCLNEMGVKCIKVKRGRNATDRKLIADVTAMLEKGESNTYILVARDGHYATLCNQILQTGAQVIVIGSKKQTAEKLKAACTTFIGIERFVKKQSKLNVSDSSIASETR